MVEKHTFVIERKNQKPILGDITFDNTVQKAPLVLFCHGYKGYKDWGAWNVMAKYLAEKGKCVVKFNFSHNGGTVEEPIDFPDLEAFAENTYTKELDDLGDVINWLFDEKNKHVIWFDLEQLTLMGHSRGGGITILKASEDKRVSKLVTLAAVSDFESRFPEGEELEKWRKEGVRYVLNGRTKQQMPHNFSFYEDFQTNKERLNILKAEAKLDMPHFIYHGDLDEAVNVQAAFDLKQVNPKADLRVIQGASHTFGTYHPYDKNELPSELKIAIEN